MARDTWHGWHGRYAGVRFEIITARMNNGPETGETSETSETAEPSLFIAGSEASVSRDASVEIPNLKAGQYKLYVWASYSERTTRCFAFSTFSDRPVHIEIDDPTEADVAEGEQRVSQAHLKLALQCGAFGLVPQLSPLYTTRCCCSYWCFHV